MQKISQHIFHRGATYYVRLRIPAALRSVYPPEKSHITQALAATDEREAKVLGHAALARIHAEFQAKRGQCDLSRASVSPKRIEKLSAEELALWPATGSDDTTFSLIASVVHTPRGSGNPMSSVVVADCTSRQQNAHVTERRVVYRWHPWHERDVSVIGMTVRAGAVLLRCRADDHSCRSIEIPEWMLDAATCCRMRLASTPVVTCAALHAVCRLLEAAVQIPATPLLQAEHPHPEGDAHGIQVPAVLERSATAISTHSASAMERSAGRDAHSDSDVTGATAAPACPCTPRGEVAP